MSARNGNKICSRLQQHFQLVYIPSQIQTGGRFYGVQKDCFSPTLQSIRQSTLNSFCFTLVAKILPSFSSRWSGQKAVKIDKKRLALPRRPTSAKRFEWTKLQLSKFTPNGLCLHIDWKFIISHSPKCIHPSKLHPPKTAPKFDTSCEATAT